MRGKEDSSSIYGATKGALIAFSRSLAIKMAKDGIRVNSISPGAILTKKDNDHKDKQIHKYFQPLIRIGRPTDISCAVEFLASNQARFITGINLPVDGGVTANLNYRRPLRDSNNYSPNNL